MNDKYVLSAEGLSIEFATGGDTVHAVNNVGLELFPGTTHGLVGESGSGKSVTALAIMRLLSRTTARVLSGRVLFDHPQRGKVDLLRLPEKEMQRVRGNHIAMIFQEPMTSLNPVKRCGPQIMESILLHGKATRYEAHKLAIKLIGEVRLPQPERIMRAWPHELSGGQKQRVMIAMAMACNPSVLIADEPTTALDVTVQKNILELMRHLLQQHDMAMLFISHDLGVIHEVADTASVMKDGSIVESGSVHQLFAAPGHPYTRALVACRPALDSRPERLATVEDFLSDDNQTTAFKKDTSHKTGPHAWQMNTKGTTPILEVRNLKTQFVTEKNFWGKATGHHPAVDDISFEVYPGETLGMVGESGCGKTTLGRSILRLIGASSGKVIYKGRDMASLSGKELRKLRPKFQVIFQDPYASLTPGISIGNAIKEPMKVHGISGDKASRKRRVMELLKQVGLREEHYYRYPHEFSGGQRQRISIARALSLEPEFLVCDEAVSALDVSVQAQVLNLLNDLKTVFGLTYIFISHDLSVVRYMSDRIMVMQHGKMVEITDADSIYTRPGNTYTRELIESIPGFHQQPKT